MKAEERIFKPRLTRPCLLEAVPAQHVSSALTVVVPLLAGLAEFDEMEAEMLESELFGNVSGTPTGG